MRMARQRNKYLQWYAITYDWTKQNIEYINILGVTFAEDIIKRVNKEKINSYNDLKNLVRTKLMNTYWCKAEYEVLINNLTGNGRSIKTDVWSQIEKNLDRIVEYIIRELRYDIDY